MELCPRRCHYIYFLLQQEVSGVAQGALGAVKQQDMEELEEQPEVEYAESEKLINVGYIYIYILVFFSQGSVLSGAQVCKNPLRAGICCQDHQHQEALGQR